MSDSRQRYHDEMFNLWREAAAALSGELRLSTDRLFSDHAVVVSALGAAWVEREGREAAKPQARFSDIHLLYRSLGSATTGDVAVSELAMYRGVQGRPKDSGDPLEPAERREIPTNIV
jgi:hypothetical protein